MQNMKQNDIQYEQPVTMSNTQGITKYETAPAFHRGANEALQLDPKHILHDQVPVAIWTAHSSTVVHCACIFSKILQMTT